MNDHLVGRDSDRNEALGEAMLGILDRFMRELKADSQVFRTEVKSDLEKLTKSFSDLKDKLSDDEKDAAEKREVRAREDGALEQRVKSLESSRRNTWSVIAGVVAVLAGIILQRVLNPPPAPTVETVSQKRANP